MQITIELADSRINDLLHGHGGSYSPWLHSLEGNLGKDGFFTVTYDLETDDEGDGNGDKKIWPSDVIKGLSLMAADTKEGGAHQFSEFMAENDDDITFDTALQFIIFGKLIYG